MLFDTVWYFFENIAHFHFFWPLLALTPIHFIDSDVTALLSSCPEPAVSAAARPPQSRSKMAASLSLSQWFLLQDKLLQAAKPHHSAIVSESHMSKPAMQNLVI